MFEAIVRGDFTIRGFQNCLLRLILVDKSESQISRMLKRDAWSDQEGPWNLQVFPDPPWPEGGYDRSEIENNVHHPFSRRTRKDGSINS